MGTFSSVWRSYWGTLCKKYDRMGIIWRADCWAVGKAQNRWGRCWTWLDCAESARALLNSRFAFILKNLSHLKRISTQDAHSFLQIAFQQAKTSWRMLRNSYLWMEVSLVSTNIFIWLLLSHLLHHLCSFKYQNLIIPYLCYSMSLYLNQFSLYFLSLSLILSLDSTIVILIIVLLIIAIT